MRIGVGLSIPELATRGGRFSPASLFTGGVQGAWYAPDDFSTLFQDSAGTTPVTAVEQPVGLMLDKSQGLVLGSELVTNGDFSSGTGWSTGGVWVISGGSASITSSTTSLSQSTLSAVVGTWYQVTFTISAFTAGGVRVEFGGVNGASRTAAGTYTQYILATSTSFLVISPIAISTLSIDNVSIKVIAGNHATQSTAASRPVLRARYTQLTYSEQFDNAAWSKTGMLAFGSGSVVNATTAPDGTTTADLLTPDTTSSTKAVRLVVTGAGANTWSFYAKANGYTKVGIWDYATSGAYAAFLLSGAGSVLDSGVGASNVTITSVGNGWYRCSFTATVTGSLGFSIQVLSPSYTTGSVNAVWSANGTDGVYLWGGMLNTGSSAGTYQRIAAATDYATAGFLPYLYFITDDSFGTNSIDFTATDAMFSCVGITKNSDAANALVYELSADLTSNNGSINLFAPIVSGGLNTYYAASKGTVSATAGTGTGVYVAPITNVVSTVSDISTPSLALRVNGSQVATSTATQGTGNYGNYPLYIGRRNNATLPLNGNLYQLIVCGKTLSASELASTEAYVNARTGAY